MDFSKDDIKGMLGQYEEDYHTGMDTETVAELIHSYTSGYPYLTSRLCKFVDEQISGNEWFPDRKSAWIKEGILEAETRNRERTDLVIDYHGEQFIIEMKLWHGNAYHERGEKQLLEYLDYFHLDKGYMLSFNFNKKKEIGVKDIVLGKKVLVEAVV